MDLRDHTHLLLCHEPTFSLLERNGKAWRKFLGGKLSVLFFYEPRAEYLIMGTTR